MGIYNSDGKLNLEIWLEEIWFCATTERVAAKYNGTWNYIQETLKEEARDWHGNINFQY